MSDQKSARECALIAAKAADDKKATDIMVQEVGAITSMTDYFVIATASNNRQVDAIIEEVEKQLREQGGIKPSSREGIEEGTWALLDYGDIGVHVVQPEARDYYRLDDLWNDCPVIDLKEAGITDAVYSDRIAKLMGAEAE
ncbi:MAG: ribosome silencing factor [Eggerthellaceae bacterium]|nr:ribosome silencing factor [Eggerthellaceae bacterium]